MRPHENLLRALPNTYFNCEWSIAGWETNKTAKQKVFEALKHDTKEPMDIDTAGDAADSLRPEQDIRHESNTA